jgi:hypothetical protein
MVFSYDVNNQTFSGRGDSDEIMLLIGNGGLSKVHVTTALKSYLDAHNGVSVKHLRVGAGFTKFTDHQVIYGTDLLSIIFDSESKITVLDGFVLANNFEMTTLILPPGLITCGDVMASGNMSLVALILPETVTSIGISAFAHCAALKSIVIPALVESIALRAFQGCSGLETVTFAPDSILGSIGNEVFADCSALQDILFPAKLTTIGDRIFRDAYHLVDIVFPPSVVTIGINTFSSQVTFSSLGNTIQTLKINENLWESFLTTFPGANNQNSTQFVTFHGTTYSLSRAPGTTRFVGPIANSGGDPYIRCLKTGTTIKLPNCCDVYRMYQNHQTGSVINCQVGPASCLDEDKKTVTLGNWGKTMDSGYFFTHLFLYDGVLGTTRVVDLTTLNLLDDPNVLPWCGAVRSEEGVENLFIGSYRARSFPVCDGGTIDLRIYPNPSIRNDLQYTLPGNMDGLLFKNYRPKLWRRNRLDDCDLVKSKQIRRPLTHRGIVGHGEVNDCVNHQDLFFQMFVTK